ncbi:probable disease resistance protein At1g61310 [Pistacia vera]|uniref:probable disease resistance protein At1g61310 n=1 Tax=Pistacia vera TaxID=55513 RepID=UPI00126371CE|nr:probable disease resistance protein At1g61310 [Pistacia vera]
MAELAAVGSIASVVSAVLEVGKCLAAPIGQFKYLYNYNNNLKSLETEVMTLKKTRDEVQGKVTAAKINGEAIKQSVEEWQTKVNNTINEAESLIREKEKNRRCFKGLRPNYINSYKHSKKAFKLKRDGIIPLLQQEERFVEVSYSSIQQSNYETNFDKIRDDVLKLKNARLKVGRKVEEAEIKGEEIEADVKKWLQMLILHR